MIVWNWCFHMPRISLILMSFCNFSIHFIAKSLFKFVVFPLKLLHNFDSNNDKKFLTGAYWGRKNTASKFSIINLVVCLAEWGLALLIKIIVLLFWIFHFALMNFLKSFKYSIKFGKLRDVDIIKLKFHLSFEIDPDYWYRLYKYNTS